MKLQVVQGYADGSAKPDQAVTRAEFLSMLSRFIDIDADAAQGVELRDVGGHWAQATVAKFAAAGIIGGYGDGTFRPDRPISREEIVAVLSRIVDLKAAAQGGGAEVNASAEAFADVGHSYAAAAIGDAAKAGIVGGRGGGRFEPSASATRAEAFTVILRLLRLNPELQKLLATL